MLGLAGLREALDCILCIETEYDGEWILVGNKFQMFVDEDGICNVMEERE